MPQGPRPTNSPAPSSTLGAGAVAATPAGAVGIGASGASGASGAGVGADGAVGPDVTRSLYDVYYERYCLLYNLYGAERRQLDRHEYERMDQELLRLIEKAQHNDLAMAEITRIKEIEYLLLDDIAEGFYS